MLRRRILASAMASVMAIGSVAVVANAETTAAATTQAKTKADLEAYVKSFDSFRSTKLDDYGSISGERFLAAIEHAENVLADTASTLDDYTVAYAMVEATYNKLKIYTAEELKALLDTNKKNYESGNVYNEELGDPIFKEGGYANFEAAYEEAEAVLNSSDSRIVTDAYENLEDTAGKLSRYDVVTKAQFRTALKEYETMLQKEYAYESWRVGTMSSDWVDLKTENEDGSGAGYWGYQGLSVAYGTLMEHIGASGTGELINDAYAQMDEIQSLTKTSLVSIVKGYYAAVNAVNLYNAWTPDDTVRGSKASVKKLLDQYHSRLVSDYATTEAAKLYNSFATALTKDGVTNLKILVTINGGVADKWLDLSKKADAAEFNDMVAKYGANVIWNGTSVQVTPDADHDGFSIFDGVTAPKVYKTADADISIKSGSPLYIPLDEDGYWTGAAVTDTKPTGKYKTVTKNVQINLTDYIRVDLDKYIQDMTDADPAFDADKDAGFDNALYNEVFDVDNHWVELKKDYPDFDKKKGGWYSEVFGKWGAIQGSIQPGATITTSDGKTVPVSTNLKDAIDLANLYLTAKPADLAANTNPIYDLDTTGSISEGSAKGSSTEWTLVYRYLKYALHDKYDTSYDVYTKADVSKLIDEAYELADKTGDASLFAVNHQKLVDARQFALDWMKVANKDKKYKDNVSAPEVNGLTYTSTRVYEILKDACKAVENDYNAFKYSFDDVFTKIADVKSMIDDGDLQATDSLLAALEETAYRLSIVESFGDEGLNLDNDAFTSDRVFQGFNRVFTAGADYKLATTTGEVKISKPDNSAASKSHDNLKNAYEALLAEVKAQTEVKTVVGDVNGDGVVNALDAAAILKAVAAGTAIDVAVGDYNADGVVNALDASAILKAVTQA